MTKPESLKIDEVLEGQKKIMDILTGDETRAGLIHLVNTLQEKQDKDDTFRENILVPYIESMKPVAEQVKANALYIEKDKERRIKRGVEQTGITATFLGLIEGVKHLFS
jgi:hypothetical protein